ncbi:MULTISPECIES: hypothetical protein [unclassified Acinetobacter]|uniref:hypothetical protein n=1 Tax=unclassified Acinetobacter TaxID=196816 RepID=UPI0015D4111D|nr:MULTISPECIES: hypothetical protein [unclassified Acinetobacter]
MNPLSLLMLENFSKLSNSFINLIKFGAGIGGVGLVYYLLKIGYLPSEFALGDGILLLMLSTVIGIIFCLIFLLLWMQGKAFFDLIFLIYSFLPHQVKSYIKEKINIKNPIIIPKVEKINNFFIYPVAILFLLIVYVKENSLGLLFYGLVSIYFYIFYILIYNVSLEYNYLAKILHNESKITTDYELLLENQRREKKNVLSILLIAFLIVPFVMGGQYNVIEKIINFSMEKSNVRVMKSRIYVKNEFSNLILKKKNVDEGYTEIVNVDILFRGGGKNTFIGFVKNGKYIKMEIPNDSILSVYHIKNK